MVLNIYEQFVEDIASARKMKLDDVRAVADGRVFTGKQALKLGLVDELGTLYDSAEYLHKKLELEGDLNLIYPPKKQNDLFQQLMEGAAAGVANGVSAGLKDLSSPQFEYRYTGP